jgi:hypothetical protein
LWRWQYRQSLKIFHDFPHSIDQLLQFLEEA